MAVNAGDKDIGGLGDGLQTGFQLWQGLVFGPCGDITQAVGAGFDAVILANGIGNTFCLHFLGVVVLGLDLLRLFCSGYSRKTYLLPVMEYGMGDLMDGGTHRLHLAHAILEGNHICFWRKNSVQVFPKRFDFYGRGRCSPQCLHKYLVLFHIPGQGSGQAGQRLSLRLAHIKYLDRTEQRNFHNLFLCNYIAPFVTHWDLGFRVQLHFLNSLFVRRRSQDSQTLLTLFHMASEFVFPLVKSCHMGGVGHLHMNHDGVVYRIVMKSRHCVQIFQILFTLEQFLNAAFDFGRNLLDLLPAAGFLFCHRVAAPLF